MKPEPASLFRDSAIVRQLGSADSKKIQQTAMGPETGNLASAHELDNFDRNTRIDDRRFPSRLPYDLAVEFHGDPIGRQPERLEQVGNACASGT